MPDEICYVDYIGWVVFVGGGALVTVLLAVFLVGYARRFLSRSSGE